MGPARLGKTQQPIKKMFVFLPTFGIAGVSSSVKKQRDETLRKCSSSSRLGGNRARFAKAFQKERTRSLTGTRKEQLSGPRSSARSFSSIPSSPPPIRSAAHAIPMSL
ncbi:hypothetical protein KSP40_PGU006079 [Platanthera guangdongensis]|uniref:Uncharacterized protein n=1 Tax=Platanthera guangdongensis TaxID=2320717 RepID=A0ABR2MZW3_9ASPA